MAASKRRVYLIDASVYIFRAYYSVPDTLTNEAGQAINALHGFAGFLAEFLEQEKPQHVAVAFDESLTSSFRNEIYPQYKANRESPPEELKLQFGFCRALVKSLGLAGYSSNYYEADDLIGTLAARLREQGFSVVILSTDKDLAQVLEAGDMQWDFARNRKHPYDAVHDWLGVHAGQVADWLALAGDSVDNIPGVPGIGAKTAAALLGHFDSLQDIYAQIDAVADLEIRGAARVQRLLKEHEEDALLARRLTGVETQADIDSDAKDVQRRSVSAEELTEMCKQLGLGRMTQARLLRLLG
ncbi:MAG: exodeoxyribonuclease IX [Halioglobus sp.]|nr:exodeoxyribonuclease IX [Halioglobus sp.]